MKKHPNCGKGQGIAFLRAHLNDPDGPCLIWPLSKDNHGYGILGLNGKQSKAHLTICEMVHGPRPSPDHQASHSCNNGHLACVHPRHISWKTRSENHYERQRHGGCGWMGKVTVEIAAQIQALEGKLTQEKIARQFGVSKPTVRRIFKRKTHAARGKDILREFYRPSQKAAETQRRNRLAS